MKIALLLLLALGALFFFLRNPDRENDSNISSQPAGAEAPSDLPDAELRGTEIAPPVRGSAGTPAGPGPVATGTKPHQPARQAPKEKPKWEAKVEFEIHLSVLGGGGLPEEVDLRLENASTSPFLHALDLPVENGVVLWTFTAHRAEALHGGLQLRAEGFGMQTYHLKKDEVKSEQTNVVKFVLEHPEVVKVRALADQDGSPIPGARFTPQGKSVKYGYGYGSNDQGLATLHLQVPPVPSELINVEASGYPMLVLTTSELMSVAPGSDGVREIRLGSGTVLTGTVRMADGTPLPERVKVMARPVTTSAEGLSQGARRAGDYSSCKLDEVGRFEIPGLPAQEISLLVGESSESLLAPAFLVRLNSLAPTDVLLEIPSHQTLLSGRVCITEGGKVGRWKNTLLYVEIYQLESAEDGPYLRQPTARVLLGEFQVSYREPWTLALPEALANSQHGLLLRAGFSADRCFERRLQLEGPKPTFEVQFQMESAGEYMSFESMDLTEEKAKALREWQQGLWAELEYIQARTP